MKVTINHNRNFQLEEVYNPIVFLSDDKEKIGIVMRDSGFELWYQKDEDSPYETYEFKNGIVNKILDDEKEPCSDESISCTDKELNREIMTNIEIFENLVEPIKNKIDKESYEFLINRTNKFIKQVVPEWISVDEKLPKNTNDVLISDDDGIVKVGYYQVESELWYESSFGETEMVEYWMELKQPPTPNS